MSQEVAAETSQTRALEPYRQPLVFGVEEFELILRLEELEWGTQIVLLLLDSGAYAHVCPPSFAPWVPLRTTGHSRVVAQTATGHKICELGERAVMLSSIGSSPEVRLVVNFRVMEIKRPLLSVGELIRRGYLVHFSDAASYIRCGDDTELHLYSLGNMHYLPVRVETQSYASLESIQMEKRWEEVVTGFSSSGVAPRTA